MSIPTMPLKTIPWQAARSADIHVRWVMPEIFHDLPVKEEDEDEAVRLLEELAEEALPGAADEDQLRFAVICALGLDDLLAAGAEYAGVCVTAIDETPCSATVFASLIDTVGDVADPVKAIAFSLRRADVGDVSEIQLPCGPAVSCIGTHDARITGELAGSEAGPTFSTSFIRVYLPLPNATTLVMEMGTPTMAGWDTFATMFGNVVSSIRLFDTHGSALIIPGSGG
ncbi:hypothetical protein [Streptomyces sp. NPDC001820]|uniref:hypothetical protein n=1 Tax=Streptomyces sp. NPDC001820 TaxID=3364613 RepID=UPI0036B48E50